MARPTCRVLRLTMLDLISDPTRTVETLAEELQSAGVKGLHVPSETEIRAFVTPSLYRASEARFGSSIPLTRSQERLCKRFVGGTIFKSRSALSVSESSRRRILEHDQDRKILMLRESLTTREAELKRKGARTMRDSLGEREAELRALRDKLTAAQREVAEPEAEGGTGGRSYDCR